MNRGKYADVLQHVEEWIYMTIPTPVTKNQEIRKHAYQKIEENRNGQTATKNRCQEVKLLQEEVPRLMGHILSRGPAECE